MLSFFPFRRQHQPTTAYHHDHHTRYEKTYTILWVFGLFLIILGFFLDTPATIWQGLKDIVRSEAALITDYVALAGPGAAFVNAGLVTLIAVALLKVSNEPANGLSVVAVSLMSGFALFGKNFLNIWPILMGTFLYSQLQKEHFGKYVILGLTSTALAPVVSFITLNSTFGNIWVGIGTGVLIGIVVTPLSAYTFKIQNGMNLYNTGFACGLIAMMFVPMMNKLGAVTTMHTHWAEGYNQLFGAIFIGFSLILILIGLFAFPLPVWAVWAGYRHLLQTSGRSPSDYLRMFGPAPVLVNTGMNGIIGISAILLLGGDLNGPTLGAIFTVMGFSSFGKHAKNIVPVMVGVALSTLIGEWGFSDSGIQLSMLFCTTLAPISGYFGWIYGIIAGILHSAVVLSTSDPVGGMNLYNNGFSGGLVAIFLYPIILAVMRHRKAEIQDEDFFDVVEHDEPITPPTHDEIVEEIISPLHSEEEEQENPPK